MTSLRHNSPDDALLDAARQCLLDVGWKRSTLTDVARRGGVSRMTIYRRWPDMQTLLADLMTREWTGVVGEAVAVPGEGTGIERLGAGVARVVTALRDNAVFRKILQVDAELLLPYLLDRRGRTQESVLRLLEAAIAEGQHDGSVREGDPALLARTVLLATYGFALSAQTMAGTTDAGEPSQEQVVAELAALVERYLAA